MISQYNEEEKEEEEEGAIGFRVRVRALGH